jgi:hypothetical protein
MMYLYNTYLLYIYMRNIYGIYVTIRYTYEFFNYMYSFIKKEENIKMLENKKS